MAELKTENVKINDTHLGFEDHGLLTFFLYLSGDGWGTGFGGIRLGGEYTSKVVEGVLKTVGVEKWEDLKGQLVRCKHEGWGGRTVAIGHPIENKWFDLENLEVAKDE